MTLSSQLSKAKKASQTVNLLTHGKRQEVLKNLAKLLRQNKASILRANARDAAKLNKFDPSRDRLLLTKERIEGMAREIDGLINLPDPIGQIYDKRVRYGMSMHRKRVPIGVIGVVYESRPNVTTDVAGICLKAGNVVLLKGGRQARYSYVVLVDLIRRALKKAGVDQNAAQMIDSTKRQLVKQLITADKYVDLVIPRGSQGLIEFVRKNASVPIIETGAGVCHTFIDQSADLDKSAKVIFNSKTQRVSVCNALDTVLIHKNIAREFLLKMSVLLLKKEVEIFADKKSYDILRASYPKNLLSRARASDFGREFLSQKLSIKVVSGIDEAIEHIAKYSSGHSEAILTNTAKHKRIFAEQVDAAVVYVNASTRFTDGAIFGLGSEIGISTQKLHARGPMGPAEMTTYKWVVAGKYSVRPD